MQKRNIALVLFILLNTLLICLIISAQPTVVAEASTEPNIEELNSFNETEARVNRFRPVPTWDYVCVNIMNTYFDEKKQVWVCGYAEGETSEEAIKNYLATIEDIYQLELDELLGKNK